MSVLARPFALPAPLRSDDILFGVDCSTWPERSDVVVSSPEGATWRFPLATGTGAVFDPLAPARLRITDALARIEREQHSLRRVLRAVGGNNVGRVRLYEVGRVRLYERASRSSVIERALGYLGLEHGEVEIAALPALLPRLEQLPIPMLYGMAVRWYELVERANRGAQGSDSWIYRAHPERRCHFHDLAGRSGNPGRDEERAYRLFLELLDVPAAQCTFGLLLRFVYFQRSEFPERPRRVPRALVELGLA